MRLINIKKVIRVTLVEARQYAYATFEPKTSAKYKLFGLIKTKSETPARWYSSYWVDYYDSREELIKHDSNLYINHDVLYEYSIWEKPHTYILMERGVTEIIYYDTNEDMYEHLNDIVSKSKGVLIEIG